MTPARAHLEALFEGAPRFLDRLVAAGPFEDDTAMFATARRIAHTMTEPDQIELIDAHPRLGAPPGVVSALSYVEQGYDRATAAPAPPRPPRSTSPPSSTGSMTPTRRTSGFATVSSSRAVAGRPSCRA